MAGGGDYLRLIDVAKSYDGTNFVVDHVDLDIRKGEFLTLLGPSGSGKTTTLTMIAGFHTPSAGQILLAGRDLTDLPPWKRNIGMVFQNYALFPHMNVARNVGFPLRMRGTDKAAIRKAVDEVLALVGLRGFAERYPRELSGGQQQRVALARALVFRPDVLLLDEPLGALDKNLREQMQFEIKRLHREVGITMIYVTHDQTEAMTMSDRIAVFNAGRVEQVAAPRQIYTKPVTHFVAAFVGDSNILPARLLFRGGALSAEVEGLASIALHCDALPGSGASVDLLIRPENIALGSSAPSGAAVTLPVKIEQVVDYGDSILVICAGAGRSWRVAMLRGSAEITAGQSSVLSFAAGDIHLIARPPAR